MQNNNYGNNYGNNYRNNRQTYNPHGTTPAKAKGNSNTVAILCCVLAVIVIIAIAVCIIYVNANINNSDTKDTPRKTITEIDAETETEDNDIHTEQETEEKEKVPEQEEQPQKEKDIDPKFKAEHTAYSAEDIIDKVTLSTPQDSPETNPGYNTIQDSKFDYKISFPRHFKQDRMVKASSRSQYASYDGSVYFRASAAFNDSSLTPEDVRDEFYETYGGDIIYDPSGDNWVALSCNDGHNYHYMYFRKADGIIKGFEFHFAGEENFDIYSEYIDYIYDSFKDI